jgi:hypothetical protein
MNQVASFMDTIYSIKFEDFENSELFSAYAYDVTKETIDYALEMLKDKETYDLVYSEIDRDWQDAFKLNENAIIPDSMKDALRIAMLVLLIRDNGVVINPVDIDTFSLSCNHLEGHHRLLALKYLKYKEFPAYLSGDIDMLETNLHIVMME